MATLIGDLKYPGLRAFNDAIATISQGITPSRITVSVPPSFGLIAEVGDLVMTDGQQTVTLRDCKVADLQGTASIQSQGGTLVMEDHRWRWAYPVISGRYNVPAERKNTVPLVPIPGVGQGNPDQLPPPDPQGTEPIDPRTKKDARAMAVLCLKAMGEPRYDVSAVPSDAYPTVEWDVTNAAQALQSLAESFGCRVCWQPLTNRVLVAKQGIGVRLPEGPEIAVAPKITVKARPSKVRVRYARSRFQLRFRLGAVGLDFDGSWRWVDDLSYKPSGGWVNFGPPFPISGFATSLPGGRTQLDAHALAEQTVYRAYRIKPTTPTGGPLRVPPFDAGAKAGTIGSSGKASQKKVEQIRLLPFLCATTRDDLGRVQQVAARCYGKHIPPDRVKQGETWIATYTATTDITEVKVPFTIDAAHQIIIFSKRVAALNSSNRTVPCPDLVLETACEVEDNDSHQFVRYFRDLVIPGGLDTAPAEFVKEDLIYEYTAHYKSGSHQFSHSTESRKYEKADFYLRGEAQKYQADEAGDKSYAGLVPIDPDGAIQQVTYTVGPAPSTRASRNTEHNLYVPSYEGRRRIEETHLDRIRRIDEAVRQRVQASIEQYGPASII